MQRLDAAPSGLSVDHRPPPVNVRTPPDPEGDGGNTGECARRRKERAIVPDGKWCCRNFGEAIDASFEQLPQEDSLHYRHQHLNLFRSRHANLGVNPVI